MNHVESVCSVYNRHTEALGSNDCSNMPNLKVSYDLKLRTISLLDNMQFILLSPRVITCIPNTSNRVFAIYQNSIIGSSLQEMPQVYCLRRLSSPVYRDSMHVMHLGRISLCPVMNNRAHTILGKRVVRKCHSSWRQWLQ